MQSSIGLWCDRDHMSSDQDDEHMHDGDEDDDDHDMMDPGGDDIFNPGAFYVQLQLVQCCV